MDKEKRSDDISFPEDSVFNTLTYACLLEKQGYWGEAKRIYETLLATYPRREVIERKLERLKEVA